MLLSEIVNKINKLISNNTSFKLGYDRIGYYLDLAIDNINQRFSTSFKTVSEYYKNYAFYFSAVKKIKEDPTNSILGPSILIDDISEFNASDYERDTDGKNLYYYFPNQNIFKVFHCENTNPNDTGTWEDDVDPLTDGWAPLESITNSLMQYIDYVEIPDRYIRNCVIYYAAASYLEEEDELENQYRIYMSKVEKELVAWDRDYFRCYKLNEHCDCHNDKHKCNPYWIGCDEHA